MHSKILIGTLIGLLIGLFLGQSALHSSTPDSVDCYANGKNMTITGTVAEEPDVRRDKTNYTIQVQRLDGKQGVNGFVLISADTYPSYAYGDQLEITGTLEKPAVFNTFDYAAYLSRYDIYAVINRPKILKISPASSSPYSFLLNIKQSFESHLSLTFPSEPANALMAGLLLGSRKGMTPELSQDFKTTGLTHIIAISGYNITLIVSIMMAMFRPLGKKASIALSAIGAILFTVFVGASAAVVRACIMGLISLLAIVSERKTNITIMLLITAGIMGAWNPRILIVDVGFQLSFLATMGLIYVDPLLAPHLRWLPKRCGIRDSITLTLSAQIMALPVLVLNFQQLSLISPISNLLVSGPIIPFTMLFGFLATVISYVSVTVAKVAAFPGYFLSEYISSIIHLTAQIPFATISITWFSEALLILYYVILTFILIRLWKLLKSIDRRIIGIQLGLQQCIAQISTQISIRA